MSSRKNKRDLTSRTVDILNGVNSAEGNTGVKPQTKSKPRVRHLPSQPINLFGSRTPQVPQSDAIWDIPSEEEEIRPASKRRAVQTESRSLRRSQRARKQVQVDDTPTRSSRRLARITEDSHRQSSEENDSEKGEELNDIIDKQLIGQLSGGLIQSVNENRSPDVRQGRIDKERGEQEDEDRRASEEPRELTSPSKKRKSRTTDAQAQEDDSEWAPNTTTRPPESTHIIQTRRLTQELASPRATRRHTLAAQAAEKEAEEPSRPNRRSLPVQNGPRNATSTRDKQGDRMAELSEVPESAEDESESESSYESEADAMEEEEEEEEAVTTQHLPDTQREEPSTTARPSKRRRTDQYQRNPQVEVLCTQPTPPMHANPLTPDDNHSRRSSRHLLESPAIATRPISVISDDAQTRDNAGDQAWLTEASKLGQQDENWRSLVAEAKKLKGKRDPSQAKSFVEIEKQLSKLRAKYKKINSRLRSQQSPLREDLLQCGHLRKAIRQEVKEILDKVWEMSTPERQAESKTLLKRVLRLIEQFEARVFPIMINVILLCFGAYYTNRKLFPSAYVHLSNAMKLLLGFCNRIKNIRICNKIPSMRAVGYIRGEEHSETISALLPQLIEALEDNYTPVQRRVNGIEGASRGEKRREWTEDEQVALLDGLKQFLGEDRYDDILWHFGRRLRHREIQELRTKAREIRDRYIPLIQDDLRTAEGSRNWQWLLSVADDQRPVSVD